MDNIKYFIGPMSKNIVDTIIEFCDKTNNKILNNNFNYNRNTNAQSVSSNSFKTNSLTLNATIYYKKVWSFISDYEFDTRDKLAGQIDNPNINLVNLKLQVWIDKFYFLGSQAG